VLSEQRRKLKLGFEMDDPRRKALNEAADWARESIAFAMSLRTHDTGKNIGDVEETVEKLMTNAEDIANKLWEETTTEFPAALISEGIREYTRKVFQWCNKHTNPVE